LSSAVPGINFFPLQSVITLPSGIYLFCFRYVVPPGSSFTINYITQLNQIAYVRDNTYINQTYLYLSGQTSTPVTCGFPNISGLITYYLFISGQRILPTI
jgi:hypothetical protein